MTDLQLLLLSCEVIFLNTILFLSQTDSVITVSLLLSFWVVYLAYFATDYFMLGQVHPRSFKDSK